MRTKKIIFLLLLLVFFLITSGCLGGLFNNKPIIGSTPETTAKVGIEYTYEIVAIDPDGDTLTYTLIVKPDAMTINPLTGVVSWTPTEDQVGENQVIIEVSDEKISVSQNFTITVLEALLDHIVVDPSEMTVYVGNSEPIISITAYYDNETSADIELDSVGVSYSIDPDTIATVNALGLVTGVSVGTATVTVSYTEEEITKTATASVTVKEQPILTGILVVPSDMIMYVGASQSIISITAHYSNAPDASIELSSVTYITNDTTVATVDSSGVVTGISVGTTTITVIYTEGGIIATDTAMVTIVLLPE